MLVNLLKSSRAIWCLAHNSSSSSSLFGTKNGVGAINRMVNASPVVFQQNPTILIRTLPFSTGSKSTSFKNDDQNNFDKQLSELDYQLNEVKVFQDEQIIQFSFKSGQSINFTMSWLRNLCSCPDCSDNKLRQVSTLAKENADKDYHFIPSNQRKSYNVSRMKCDPGAYEFEIEWLDDDYRSHPTVYDLRQLILKKP